ncbi:hypothetical protein OHA21_43915 [Actinoplanes sp. NBC_00393]|uniref:hypothetical protein n=1 Tax=Actinoplanes sp. NBC_00393 TaxID=2975953 RepID=UPI002E22512B
MTAKDYPPAPVVHDAHRCDDAPAGIRVSANAAREAAPNARAHRCFSRVTVVWRHDVVIEPVEYEPHAYEASTILSCEDGIQATRPLCRICRGTHGEQPPAEPVPGRLFIPGHS